MQAINARLASVLSTAFRAPRVYGLLSIPLLKDTQGTIDYTKYGQNFLVDNILSLRRMNILEPGSDSIDLGAVDNNADLSPINLNSNFGRFFYPGAVDNKLSLYMGLATLDGVNETVLPKGVYIVKSFKQENREGTLTTSINGLDNWDMFQGQIMAQFPPRLYGNQQSSYYNPNYALTPLNASGGTATQWACDAVNWMQNSSDNKVWSTDFVQPAVYVSTDSNGTIPTSLPYTIDYPTGTVTFTSPLTTLATVSVDARPLAMAPEKILQHLFVDFGNFSLSSCKFDFTGIVLPVLDHSRDQSILDIAKSVAFCCAVRGLRWRIYFDENGSLIFTEDCTDGAPVKVLTDREHILRTSPEFTSADIANVVRATGRCITDQPLTVVSFDVRSINEFSQRPTFDVPTQLVTNLVGMDPGSALAYLNGLTSSFLFEYSTPTISMELDILPDPSLQVNDLIWVRDTQLGLDRPFFIKQITDNIQADTWTQTLTVEQFKNSQDFMYGLGAYAGAPIPSNPSTLQAASSLISVVTIAGTTVVNAGMPLLDSHMNPVIAQWNGGSLPISITLAAPPAGGTSYIWRWIYIGEDAAIQSTVCAGDGSAAGVYTGGGFSGSLRTALSILFGSSSYVNRSIPMPYDVLNNVDTPRSRKYWRPLLRCSDWIANDGVIGYPGMTTFASTWTGGVGAASPQVYGQLRVGITDYYNNTSSGFSGQALYRSGTPAANVLGASSTAKYGVDFGTGTNATINYAINKKNTPAYLCILTANTAGSVQYKRIPFNLAV